MSANFVPPAEHHVGKYYAITKLSPLDHGFEPSTGEAPIFSEPYFTFPFGSAAGARGKKLHQL